MGFRVFSKLRRWWTRPRFVLWGQRRNDVIVGHEVVVHVADATAFPRGLVEVQLNDGYHDGRHWVLLDDGRGVRW